MIALALTEKSKKQEKQTFPIKVVFSFVAPMIPCVQTPPPLRIFFEGRGVCTQDIPMINAQFRHEYSTVFLSLA